MMSDYFKYIINNLVNRKVRSLLTVIGIFIGIAAVVSLISLGRGLQYTITQQFQMMGIDKIIITPGGSFFGVGAGAELTEKDLDAIKKVKDVKLAGGYLYKSAKVRFEDETKYTWVTGLPMDESKTIIEDMQNFKVERGRDLEKRDKYRALIAIRIAEGDFFKKKVKIGNKVYIENKEFDVVGRLSRIGNPEDDSQLMIPLESARTIFDEPENLNMIIAQVQNGVKPNDVAEKIKGKLRKLRDVPEGEEDFSVKTSEQLLETFQTIFTIVEIVFIGIAAISLFVGGIGIMNTMYTAILERTNEIGVMKAIGAKNRDILFIFLIESGFLGLIGGFIGIGMGIGFSKLVELLAIKFLKVNYLKAYFPWYLILGALVFSLIVGALSGILPAIQASRLKPVDALRYE